MRRTGAALLGLLTKPQPTRDLRYSGWPYRATPSSSVATATRPKMEAGWYRCRGVVVEASNKQRQQRTPNGTCVVVHWWTVDWTGPLPTLLSLTVAAVDPLRIISHSPPKLNSNLSQRLQASVQFSSCSASVWHPLRSPCLSLCPPSRHRLVQLLLYSDTTLSLYSLHA